MCMKRDKEGKGSVSVRVCVCVYECVRCVYLCEGKGQTNRHGDKETKKMEGQSGVKEKKVIKSSRISYFTFTQRLMERACSRV